MEVTLKRMKILTETKGSSLFILYQLQFIISINFEKKKKSYALNIKEINLLTQTVKVKTVFLDKIGFETYIIHFMIIIL